MLFSGFDSDFGKEAVESDFTMQDWREKCCLASFFSVDGNVGQSDLNISTTTRWIVRKLWSLYRHLGRQEFGTTHLDYCNSILWFA